jgi:hypothetical protein
MTLGAPVTFIIFNRPDKAAIVFEQIRKARPAKLFIVGDGPRASKPGEAELVEQGRAIVDKVDWPCELKTNFAPKNMGARRRVASGLDWVFSHVNETIILEDDCLPEQSFFPFCEELLERFRTDDRIAVISGNNHLKGKRVSPESYTFSGTGHTWGWATWKRVWEGFGGEHGLKDSWTKEEQKVILSRIPSLVWRQSFGRMLKNAAHLDAWDIPFSVHCQERGYVSVVPEVNLVTNIGFGVGSTHTKFESLTLQSPSEPMEFPLRHPESVEVNHYRDRVETRLFMWLRISYPFRHPVDFVMRYVRYFALLLRSKRAGETGALPRLDTEDSR